MSFELRHLPFIPESEAAQKTSSNQGQSRVELGKLGPLSCVHCNLQTQATAGAKPFTGSLGFRVVRRSTQRAGAQHSAFLKLS